MMDAPTAAELEANAVVQAAFTAAWADSMVDDPVLRHEEGGFIFVNAVTGEIVVRRVPPGRWDMLDLSYPPAISDCYLVATYHTHPLRAASGLDPEPSPVDRREADGSGVPWFVISDLGVYVVGPERRVGGLTGPNGYPI